MEQKVNIAELLKDCPRGTKLYLPLCGECELFSVTTESGIKLIYHDRKIYLDDCGYAKFGDGECLLFPSKEVRDWGCFNARFAKGDNAKQILINNGGIDDGEFVETILKVYYIDSVTNIIEAFDGLTSDEQSYILKTGTELKLEEKEQPKFKVGDVVVLEPCGLSVGSDGIGVITSIRNGNTFFVTEASNVASYTENNIQRLATPEDIAKWNEEVLQPNHLHYSTSKRKIISDIDKKTAENFGIDYMDVKEFIEVMKEEE